MTDAEQVNQALAELWDIVKCRCHEAYTGRGLHDPDCECDSTDALQIVTDRIEALVKERDDYAHKLMQANNTYTEMHLEIERLSDKLATCEKYRDAYAECDRIGTQAVRDLEAKLAKAVEVLNALDATLDRNGWHVDSIAREDIRATLAEIKSGVATTPYGLEGESHE